MVGLKQPDSPAALRAALIDIGRRLYERGMVVAAEGNISARLPDGDVLITPAGLCKGLMSPSDLVVVSASGEKRQGTHRPSTELGMHLTALKSRPDVQACVHAHPPYATAFAVAGMAIEEPILPEVIGTLGIIPLAEYATPSTAQVGASIERLLQGHDAILLRNHGALTLGSDLESAFRKMETVERCAQILHLARQLGTVHALTASQVEEIRALASTASGVRS